MCWRWAVLPVSFCFSGRDGLWPRKRFRCFGLLRLRFLCMGIPGVLRGYFQAHKSMAQTSVSQILEQVANAVVSVAAACLLIQTFLKTMEVPQDAAGQVSRATYGAIGSALGNGGGSPRGSFVYDCRLRFKPQSDSQAHEKGQNTVR